MAKEYRLVDYYDVWENPEGDYQVNDLSRTEELITITDDTTDNEIFEYLKNVIGYFKKEVEFSQVVFDWWDDFVCEFFEENTMMPLGRLELERR